MPAGWVELLLRIDVTLDDADSRLSDADRAMFYTHVLATATRRQHKRACMAIEHPLPSGEPLHARNPSGD